MNQLSTLAVLSFADFKSAASERFTVYLDVLVFWDEDHDPRVLTVIDEFGRRGMLATLAAVSESKGVMTFWWFGAVPTKAPPTADPDGEDSWATTHRVIPVDGQSRRTVLRP